MDDKTQPKHDPKAAARETIIRLAIKEYSTALTHVEQYRRRAAEANLTELEIAEAKDAAAVMLKESQRFRDQAEHETRERFRLDHPFRAWWRDWSERGGCP